MSRLQHKRGRKSNYVKSLNNTNHKLARVQALIRDNYKCRICNSEIDLEFHHISYHVLGKELIDNNLRYTVIVCGECHQEIHNDINHKWNPKNPFKNTA